MSAFAGVLLLALHAALMLGAAPLVQGVVERVAGRTRGRVGPPLLQPWRDLVRLGRKTGLVPSTASPLHRAGLLAACSLTVTASLLVPSFVTGMASAPLADVALIGALLAAARLALALAVLDSGEAAAGIAAGRLVLAAGLAQPGLLLLLLGLALAAGTTNLDGMIAALRDQPAPAGAACLAVLAALLLGLADAGQRLEAAASGDLSGAELALLQHTGALRQLVWLTMIASLLPFEPAGSLTLDGLALGAVGWAGKVMLLAGALGVTTGAAGSSPPRRMPALLGLGTLAALLACCLMVAAQRGA